MAPHRRARIAYSGRDCGLYYWRTRAGVGVDFVVYGEDGFWAIEVKSAATVRSQALRPLRSFRDDYPEYVPIPVDRGLERLLVDGVLCVPGVEFLRPRRLGR